MVSVYLPTFIALYIRAPRGNPRPFSLPYLHPEFIILSLTLHHAPPVAVPALGMMRPGNGCRPSAVPLRASPVGLGRRRLACAAQDARRYGVSVYDESG